MSSPWAKEQCNAKYRNSTMISDKCQLLIGLPKLSGDAANTFRTCCQHIQLARAENSGHTGRGSSRARARGSNGARASSLLHTKLGNTVSAMAETNTLRKYGNGSIPHVGAPNRPKRSHSLWPLWVWARGGGGGASQTHITSAPASASVPFRLGITSQHRRRRLYLSTDLN